MKPTRVVSERGHGPLVLQLQGFMGETSALRRRGSRFMEAATSGCSSPPRHESQISLPIRVVLKWFRMPQLSSIRHSEHAYRTLPRIHPNNRPHTMQLRPIQHHRLSDACLYFKTLQKAGHKGDEGRGLQGNRDTNDQQSGKKTENLHGASHRVPSAA